MEKVKTFFTKPKNIYLSVLLMFTVVMGLASVSFSYYVDESTNDTKLVELKVIDNRISSDSLVDGKVTLGANEAKDIELYVISNNDFDTVYKLYYLVDNQYVDVVLNSDINDVIGAKDVHKVLLSVENYSDEEVKVTIGIDSSYVGSEIKLSGTEITKE